MLEHLAGSHDQKTHGKAGLADAVTRVGGAADKTKWDVNDEEFGQQSIDLG